KTLCCLANKLLLSCLPDRDYWLDWPHLFQCYGCIMKISAFRLFSLILGLIITVGCSDNTNNQPTEGVHYKALPVNLTTYRLAPVTEVFSLTCGHCRTMEPLIPELEKITGEHF